MTDDPHPIVTVPKDARSNDIRWSVMRMVIGRTRDMRVMNAHRVLRSRSPQVTEEHRSLARRILEGSGDMLLQKGIE